MRYRLCGLCVLTVWLLLGCSGREWQREKGKRLQSEGRPAAALDLFQSWLAHSPRADGREQSGAWFQIGECLKALDRPGEAAMAYIQAIEIDPANNLARLRLGEIYLLGGSVELAQEQARKVIQRVGANADAFELLGTAAAVEDEVPVATDALRRALELDPKRTRVAISLAELLNRAGQHQQAREVLWDAVLQQPNSSAPYLALARLAEQDALTQEAEYAYRKAVETENTPENNLHLAQFLERSSKMDEAERVLRAIDAAQAGAPFSYADFQLHAGKPLEAGEEYASGLASTPSKLYRTQLISRLIEAGIQAGQQGERRSASFAAARENLARFGTELDQTTRLLLRAELELAGGDLTLAATELNKAAEAAPQSPAVHYLAGVLRQKLNDPAGAMSEWQAALESRSEFVPARMALAAQMLGSGDIEAAGQYIVPVVRLEPANLEALVIFCRVLVARGSYDAARAITNRIEALDKRTSEPSGLSGDAGVVFHQMEAPGSQEDQAFASHGVQAYILRGDIAMAKRKPGDALLEYEKAMLIDTRSDEAMRGLMRAYGKGSITRPMLLRMEEVAAGDRDLASLMELTGHLFAKHGWTADALRCFRRASQMDPARSSASRAVQYEAALQSGDSSGVAANNLAWIYAQQHRKLDRALVLALHARQMAPENPAVLDTLGVVRLARREYSMAVGTLQLARKLAQAERSLPQQQGPSSDAPEAAVLVGINRHLAEAYLRVGETERASLLVGGVDRP
ncbi:MAG: tetratricopeptide repeat protein [Candidatus Korobacteraceae bacterium]